MNASPTRAQSRNSHSILHNHKFPTRFDILLSSTRFDVRLGNLHERSGHRWMHFWPLSYDVRRHRPESDRAQQKSCVFQFACEFCEASGCRVINWTFFVGIIGKAVKFLVRSGKYQISNESLLVSALSELFSFHVQILIRIHRELENHAGHSGPIGLYIELASHFELCRIPTLLSKNPIIFLHAKRVNAIKFGTATRWESSKSVFTFHYFIHKWQKHEFFSRLHFGEI